ncbi:hypothetical protein AVEN_195862-1 [Araneus ventricosus]|uniref:Uncharacterized protein n=1 Tax=Araneus ventricosus TaxID=182803 RepID=A0A4Y2DTX1_ARAVE|nr:hypothetical protein AVEN_195862-1 [Araneus ventricosus]
MRGPVKTAKKRKSAEKLESSSSSNKRKAKPGTKEMTAGNQENFEMPEGRLACPFKAGIREIGLQNFLNLFAKNITAIFGINPEINVEDVVIVLHYCLQGQALKAGVWSFGTARRRKSTEKLDSPSSSNKRKAQPGTEEMSSEIEETHKIPERSVCPLAGITKICTGVLRNVQIEDDASCFLAVGLHNFIKILSGNSSTIFRNKTELEAKDVSMVLVDYFGENAMKVATSEGIKCVVLYESGLISFKPRKVLPFEAKMNLRQEQAEEKDAHIDIALRKYCYKYGKSLPSNASLMVGKRFLQG